MNGGGERERARETKQTRKTTIKWHLRILEILKFTIICWLNVSVSYCLAVCSTDIIQHRSELALKCFLFVVFFLAVARVKAHSSGNTHLTAISYILPRKRRRKHIQVKETLLSFLPPAHLHDRAKGLVICCCWCISSKEKLLNDTLWRDCRRCK